MWHRKGYKALFGRWGEKPPKSGMKQLVDIADSGNIMPPKTTWFEPKLRSGLAIHKLS